MWPAGPRAMWRAMIPKLPYGYGVLAALLAKRLTLWQLPYARPCPGVWREKKGQPRFAIVATDISHRAIAEARLGVYQERRLCRLCPTLKDKYFDRVGPSRYRVKPSLRSHICFLTSNVLDSKPPLIHCKLNLIYCQNMLIYFRRWQRREIVNQLTQQMKCDGHLILGMGELGTWTPANLTRSVPRNVQAYSKKPIEIAAAVSSAAQAENRQSQQAIRRY